MPDSKNEVTTSPADEIQELLQEIPDEVLIGVIADRFQRDHGEEVKKFVQMESKESFSGPIPPPAMLGEYDTIEKGLANRIVSMPESQQAHRQKMENTAISAAVKTESRGQNYALFLSTLIILGSLYLISIGKEISGSILAGGTLTGLAYVFISGRKKEESKDD